MSIEHLPYEKSIQEQLKALYFPSDKIGSVRRAEIAHVLLAALMEDVREADITPLFLNYSKELRQLLRDFIRRGKGANYSYQNALSMCLQLHRQALDVARVKTNDWGGRQFKMNI